MFINFLPSELQPRTQKADSFQRLMAYSVMAAVGGQMSKINAWSLYLHGIYRSMVSPYERGIVQELCESRGGRPGLSVLTSLLASVDVKNY